MMKKNRALIVTPFFNYSYDVRIKYVEKYFINNKYETSIISSNFDHRTKNEYKNDKSNLTLIEVPSIVEIFHLKGYIHIILLLNLV